MHPVLIQQLAADHIKEMHAMAAHERRARQAWRACRRAFDRTMACGQL